MDSLLRRFGWGGRGGERMRTTPSPFHEEQDLPQQARISLTTRSCITKELKAIRRGTYQNLKSLTISVGSGKRKTGLPRRKLEELFKELGSLPALEEFIVDHQSYTGEATFLLVSAFAAFLNQATQSVTPLKRLELHHVEFDQKKQIPWHLLCDLPHLESVEIDHCWEICADNDDDDDDYDRLHWKPLIEALTKILSLRHLTINSACDNRRFAWKALLFFLDRCPWLEELYIRGMELSSDGFVALAPSLQLHPNLRTFGWSRICFESYQAKEALVDLLTHNKTLQSLEFCPIFSDREAFLWTTQNGTGFEEEAEARYRSFLVETLPRALRRNTALKQCSVALTGKDLLRLRRIQVRKAWLELVQDHNFVLEELDVGTWSCRTGKGIGLTEYTGFHDHVLQVSLQHYLRLNQLGRKHLQGGYGQLTKEDWILALEKANDNIPCLYDVLQMNPGIVELSID